MKDSTLGDEKKGFQKLANDKAKAKQPITTTSLQQGLASLAMPHYANGGQVMDISSAFPPDLSLSGGAPIMPSQSDFDVNSVANESAPVTTQGMTPSDSPGLDNAELLGALRAAQAQQPQAPAPMPPAQPAAPAPHPMQQAAQALQSTPDTDPGIYAGMTSADRLAMQQKLMAQRNSPGAMAGNALAGLGDAITNSYGHGNSHFLQGNIDNQAKARAEALSGVDTAREQKLQDIQGPMAAQMADPKSPLAVSMRKMLQSDGLRVPSGMPPSVMIQVAGPLGELAMKQATLAVQQQQVNATQSNQEAERHLQAAKDLQDRGIVRKGWEAVTGDSPETAAMRDELKSTGAKTSHSPAAAPAPHGIPDLGGTFNGHKVLSVKKVS